MGASDYLVTSIIIDAPGVSSTSKFIGSLEFNGHRLSGQINYSPTGNSNGNTVYSGISVPSEGKIRVDILLSNNVISS